jgi:hypothetical protein
MRLIIPREAKEPTFLEMCVTRVYNTAEFPTAVAFGAYPGCGGGG